MKAWQKILKLTQEDPIWKDLEEAKKVAWTITICKMISSYINDHKIIHLKDIKFCIKLLFEGCGRIHEYPSEHLIDQVIKEYVMNGDWYPAKPQRN